MGWQDRDYPRGRRPDPDEGSIDEDVGGNGDDDEDGDDPEAPDASDRDDHDEPDFVRCPTCRKMIVEDAERCPHCGTYVEAEKVGRERPVWVWVGLAAALLIAVLWAIAG